MDVSRKTRCPLTRSGTLPSRAKVMRLGDATRAGPATIAACFGGLPGAFRRCCSSLGKCAKRRLSPVRHEPVSSYEQHGNIPFCSLVPFPPPLPPPLGEPWRLEVLGLGDIALSLALSAAGSEASCSKRHFSANLHVP